MSESAARAEKTQKWEKFQIRHEDKTIYFFIIVIISHISRNSEQNKIQQYYCQQKTGEAIYLLLNFIGSKNDSRNPCLGRVPKGPENT